MGAKSRIQLVRHLFKVTCNPGDGAFMLTGRMARRVLCVYSVTSDSITIQILILLTAFHPFSNWWLSHDSRTKEHGFGNYVACFTPDPEICDPSLKVKQTLLIKVSSVVKKKSITNRHMYPKRAFHLAVPYITYLFWAANMHTHIALLFYHSSVGEGSMLKNTYIACSLIMFP